MAPGLAGERGVLPLRRAAGPMPWLVAAMAFLAGLALVAAFSLDAMADGFGPGLSRRLTVQIVTTDARLGAREAAAALARLGRLPDVADARAVPQAEMDRLLAPWLGPDAHRAVPLPTLIDVELVQGARAEVVADALAPVAPHARIDRHDAALAPLAGLVAALRLLALALLLLMGAAVAAIVVLAARSALESQRDTVDILHLLGAADVQVARLFARRLAADALAGAALGALAAALVLAVLGRAVSSLDSGLAGLAAPGWGARVALVLLPPTTAALALVAARRTVLATLRHAP